MSGKGPYECFTCKNNGFPAVMVYLAGKDDQGRAIRQEEDGSPHYHKSKVPSQQQQGQQQIQPTLSDIVVQLKLIQQKIDALTEMFRNKAEA